MPTKHAAYATIATALSTELNTLVLATASAASAAIDNTTTLELFADVELVIAAQGLARLAGANFALYIVQALDGTNYGDASIATAELVAMFPMDAATTARRAVVRDVPVPPGLFKLFLMNNSGRDTAATGNTVKYRLHSLAST